MSAYVHPQSYPQDVRHATRSSLEVDDDAVYADGYYGTEVVYDSQSLDDGVIRPNEGDHTDLGQSQPSNSSETEGIPEIAKAPPQSGEKLGFWRTARRKSPRNHDQPPSVTVPSWKPELLAVFLSLSAIITMVTLLIYADKRPIQAWNFFISFNTVISILAAVARVPLAYAIGSCLSQEKWNWFKARPDSLRLFESFETAGRGPLGSFWFLMKLRVRHWTLLGPFVTILLLGFEPFFQAIIYYDGWAATPHDSQVPTISVGSTFAAGSYSESPPGSYPPYPNTKIDNNHTFPRIEFQGQQGAGFGTAILGGFQIGSAFDTPHPFFQCLTGNCTWTPFASLAVCSSCNDVSKSLVRSENHTDEGQELSIPRQYPSPSGKTVTYALPYVSLTNLAVDDDEIPAYIAASSVLSPDGSVAFQHLKSMFMAAGIVRASETYEQKVTQWEDTKVTATECALYLCVRAYQSRVENGVLSEDILGTWSDRVDGSYRIVKDITDPHMNDQDFEEFEKEHNYTLCPSTLHSTSFSRLDLQMSVPAAEARRVSLPAEQQLTFNATQGGICGSLMQVGPTLFGTEEDAAVVWPDTNLDTTVLRISSEMLHASDDYERTFARLATSLTNWIRDSASASTSGDANGGRHRGTQQEWATYIRVRWGYLALPLVAFSAGCAFVALSIFNTRRLGLEPWKADVNATFAYAVDAETRAQLRFAFWNKQPKATVNKVVVQLRDYGGGWELGQVR
ncbi:hypothetical protein F4808DRAFT_439688 [Astrocystis sublimbata]|nr:hypothetical protein F4808DRAFT_439688 [Astrocystis sublimbata]